MQNIYFKPYGRLFSLPNHISREAIIFGYRLFLDREPESRLAIADMLRRVATTQDIRREFVRLEEFKIKTEASILCRYRGRNHRCPSRQLLIYKDYFLTFRTYGNILAKESPIGLCYVQNNSNLPELKSLEATFISQALIML